MESNHNRENFHLTLKVRRPLEKCEEMDRHANGVWLEAVQKLLTKHDDGSYPWQSYVLGDGTVVKFKSLEDYISSEDGLRTSPARMLRLLEADTLPGASEVAEKLRAALVSPGRRTDLGNNVTEVPAQAKGNSKARTIRQIRQLSESDAPNALLAADLLERVHRGEISANKAAIDLGLRNRVVNFDLNKLTPEVRNEIDNLKAQEDWTTAEVMEEALRAYFRILNADEPQDTATIPAESPVAKEPPKPAKRKSRWDNVPDNVLKGIQVAELCGVNPNNIGNVVKRNHDAGVDAELTSTDGQRMFVRKVGEPFWKEVL